MAEPVKKRPPNPSCGTCNHPKSFHTRSAVKHRSPCNAFGCACSQFKAKEAK